MAGGVTDMSAKAKPAVDGERLEESLREAAEFFEGDAAAWGVDTYNDGPLIVRLLGEAADAVASAQTKQRLVIKTHGYRFPGRIVGEFEKSDGTKMVNVESLCNPGMVHIFPASTVDVFHGSEIDLLDAHIEWLREYYSQAGKR